MKWYLEVIAVIITIISSCIILMEYILKKVDWGIMEEYRYYISIIFFLIYTMIIMILTYLLTNKKKLSREIQENNVLEEDFKLDKIVKLQEIIKNMVIPQLQNKVVKRSELKQYKGEFFVTWLDGCDNGFSTVWGLTSGLISEKIFNNIGDISSEIKKVDEKLYQNIIDLKKGLEDYDIDVSLLLKTLNDIYIETGRSGWQNVAELHWYKLFDVEIKKRRKYHKANEKDMLQLTVGEMYNKANEKDMLQLNELNKMRDSINKKAKSLIALCQEIVKWTKKKEEKRKLPKSLMVHKHKYSY